MQFMKWVFLGFGAFCLILVAAVLNSSYIYYMGAILLTLPCVSYALGWYSLRGIEFTRAHPPTSWEGEEAELVYTVRNPTSIARFFLIINEALPSWLEPVEAEPTMFNVAAHGENCFARRVRCTRRGACALTGFDVTAMDPLGVFAFSRRIPDEGELVVYPSPRALRQLPLTGSDQAGWQEFTSRAIRGSSVDPDGARPYAPGDPLRFIHWRQTARTGNLSVIEFEQTMALSYVMALDLHRDAHFGTGADSTLEFAIRFVASVAQQATQQGASVRLLTPKEDGRLDDPLGTTVGYGQSHLMRVFDMLARAQGTATTPIASVIESDLGHVSAGSTVLVVTSALDTRLPAVLRMGVGVTANAAVVYVDPSSFPNGRTAEQSALLSVGDELIADGVSLLSVRWNEAGDVSPTALSMRGTVNDLRS